MKEYVSFVSIKKEAGIRKYFLVLCEVLRLLDLENVRQDMYNA